MRRVDQNGLLDSSHKLAWNSIELGKIFPKRKTIPAHTSLTAIVLYSACCPKLAVLNDAVR
jgi:hypothetical protein